MPRREIVQIDEAKCDGCGLCVPACAEGAIQIVEGKARLIADAYCDGLGACLGECPRGAITIIEREAAPFDEELAGQAATHLLATGSPPSGLGNWPVQLHLVPPGAPFLNNADLLLVADCVPFAMVDFHARLLHKRPVVIGCPKLDDANFYVEKLARIIATSNLHSLTVIHMEVPCCTGLVRIAEKALRMSGSEAPLETVTVSIQGRIVPPPA